MRNTICAALTALTLATCTALAGCGGTAKTTRTHADTGITTCSASQNGIRTCAVTLPDTRRVDCVVTSNNQGKSGITCDWAHASGSDEEPTR